MSNIQIGVTAAIVIVSLGLAFYAVARFAASETFVQFSHGGVSGAFCAWIGMGSVLPGALVLVALYKTQQWHVSEWFVVPSVFLVVAVILVAMFYGDKKSQRPH